MKQELEDSNRRLSIIVSEQAKNMMKNKKTVKGTGKDYGRQ